MLLVQQFTNCCSNELVSTIRFHTVVRVSFKSTVWHSNASILLVILIIQNQVQCLNVFLHGSKWVACFSILTSHHLITSLPVFQPCWSPGSCVCIVSCPLILFSLLFSSKIQLESSETLPDSSSVGCWYLTCARSLCLHYCSSHCNNMLVWHLY